MGEIEINFPGNKIAKELLNFPNYFTTEHLFLRSIFRLLGKPFNWDKLS